MHAKHASLVNFLNKDTLILLPFSFLFYYLTAFNNAYVFCQQYLRLLLLFLRRTTRFAGVLPL